jgi:hypothetical protein
VFLNLITAYTVDANNGKNANHLVDVFVVMRVVVSATVREVDWQG